MKVNEFLKSNIGNNKVVINTYDNKGLCAGAIYNAIEKCGEMPIKSWEIRGDVIVVTTYCSR